MTRSGLARLAAAAAGLLFLLPPAPASADPWLAEPCATGAITSHETSVLLAGVMAEVSIEGWIQPCAETVSNGFAVGRYTNLTASYRAIKPYDSTDAPTPYSASTYVSISDNDITAICLLNAPDGRVACVGLEPSGAGGPPVVTPLSTQDPRVHIRAEAEPIDRSTPTCGSCL
jgi:hypothetical protein